MEIQYGLEMAQYLAHPGVSASDLKNLQRSPAYAQWRTENSTPDTPATLFGTAMHVAILEPERFEDFYCIEPQQPADDSRKAWRSTRDYKAQAAEMRDAGYELLSQEEWDGCLRVRENVAEHRIGKLIEASKTGTEISAFAFDEEHEVTRKIRPDLLAEAARTVVDAKSTRNIQPRLFARDCLHFGYHISAAFYLDTLDLMSQVYDHYVFLAVSNTMPHEVIVYTLDHDSLAQGRSDYLELLRQWNEHVGKDEWPMGPDGIQELRLPDYAINYHQKGMR